MHVDPNTRTLTAEVFPPGMPPEPQSLEVLPPQTPAAPRVDVLPGREPRKYDPRTTPDFTPFACSEEIDQLTAALSNAQRSFDVVQKNKTAIVDSRREGARSYRYNYADLNEVISATRPHLSENGLVLLQLPIVRQRTVTILGLLTHTSGQWLRTDLPMTVESLDPQSIGTAASYGRRYQQLGLFNLAPADGEDTDFSQTGRPLANGHQTRPGQGPVQMPQRAESASPPSSASAPAPSSASTTTAASNAVTPAPASGSRWIDGPLSITHLHREQGAKGPYWKVRFSDGTACATFSTTMGADLEQWKRYEARFGKAKVTTKGQWTYLDELKPFDGPVHPGQ